MHRGYSRASSSGLRRSSAVARRRTRKGLTGGHDEQQLDGGVWRVRYGGNGYTTYETVQTYWLNHCAELALAKGAAGFQISRTCT